MSRFLTPKDIRYSVIYNFEPRFQFHSNVCTGYLKRHVLNREFDLLTFENLYFTGTDIAFVYRNHGRLKHLSIYRSYFDTRALICFMCPNNSCNCKSMKSLTQTGFRDYSP